MFTDAFRKGNTAFRQGQYDSKQISNRLISNAVIPQLNFKADQLASALEEPIDKLVDGIFVKLSGYLGKDEDLATQVPGIPALSPWNPLDLPYEKRKRATAFFMYTLSPGILAKGAAFRYKIHGERNFIVSGKLKPESATLINTLKGLSGLSILGRTIITIKPMGDTAIYPVSRATGRLRRSRNKAVPEMKVEQILAESCDISVRLFSNFNQTDRSQIEKRIFEKGGFSEQILRELVNPRGYKRPMIGPFMAYYSQILVPAIIRSVVKRTFKAIGSIKIKGSSGANNIPRDT